jgi:hypothetical protein
MTLTMLPVKGVLGKFSLNMINLRYLSEIGVAECVYPGSVFFHPGSQIQIRNTELTRMCVFLTQKVLTELSEI